MVSRPGFDVQWMTFSVNNMKNCSNSQLSLMRWQIPKAWLMHQLFDINREIEPKRNFNLILILRLGVVPSICMCRQLKLMWSIQTPHLHSLHYICLSNELLLLGKFIGTSWNHGFLWWAEFKEDIIFCSHGQSSAITWLVFQ